MIGDEEYVSLEELSDLARRALDIDPLGDIFYFDEIKNVSSSGYSFNEIHSKLIAKLSDEEIEKFRVASCLNEEIWRMKDDGLMLLINVDNVEEQSFDSEYAVICTRKELSTLVHELGHAAGLKHPLYDCGLFCGFICEKIPEICPQPKYIMCGKYDSIGFSPEDKKELEKVVLLMKKGKIDELRHSYMPWLELKST